MGNFVTDATTKIVTVTTREATGCNIEVSNGLDLDWDTILGIKICLGC